jgi:hypothetical protein
MKVVFFFETQTVHQKYTKKYAKSNRSTKITFN